MIEIPSRQTSKEILNHYQQVETGAVARGLPVKFFTKKEAAENWLLDQIKENKK